MGILDRISTLLKSNLNAAIDAMTDPGREIEQLILEMETQTRRAREEVTRTLAVEKRCKQRLDELGRSVDEWQARAQRAVQAGDDTLAREALVRQQEISGERAEAERTFAEQKAYVDQLTQALRALEQRLKEVKLRKETLKAQARAQKGRGAASTEAFDRYDRLQTQVDVVEAEAALDEELAAARHEDAKSREVERKLGELEHKNEIEDRLAALKAKMEKKD
jgi:phage shock protein A